MPSSNSTEHTPLKLCAIVDSWLRDNGYVKLQITHGTLTCGITTPDVAANNFYVGCIEEDIVILYDDTDEYNSQTLSAYDPKFFDLLAEGLKFAKP